MRKAISLIEVLVAVAIFSALSVSLYLFLHSGIRLREKLQTQQTGIGAVYERLELIARTARNAVVLTPASEEYPSFQGTEHFFEVYCRKSDYARQGTSLRRVAYTYSGGVLTQTERMPFLDEEGTTRPFIEEASDVSFYYYDEEEDEANRWKTVWTDSDRLPRGIRIAVTPRDAAPIIKDVFLYVTQ